RRAQWRTIGRELARTAALAAVERHRRKATSLMKVLVDVEGIKGCVPGTIARFAPSGQTAGPADVSPLRSLSTMLLPQHSTRSTDRAEREDGAPAGLLNRCWVAPPHETRYTPRVPTVSTPVRAIEREAAHAAPEPRARHTLGHSHDLLRRAAA